MSLKKSLISLFSAAMLALSVASAFANDRPPYGPSIDLATAKKMATAAIAEAIKNKWNVAVTVVDTHGFLVYFEKLDQTQTGSNQVAIDKARSAAMYRRSTRVFQDAVSKGSVGLLTLSGMSAVSGGLPIMKDGKVIGAIGTSGVTSDQDEQISQAGLDFK
jgi:uncharacterized protein GlcG (DUF336 family)